MNNFPDDLAAAPIVPYLLVPLLGGAWTRRDRHRLLDGLSVELADTLGRSRS